MRFVSVDVETANADRSSVCAIGIVVFEDGGPVEEHRILIDPQDEFDLFNVSIHGIKAVDVVGAPTFGQVLPWLVDTLRSGIVVSHTAFDRVAIERATKRCSGDFGSAQWLDTAMIARRSWAECSQKGYGLKNVCDHIGHSFDHHDPLADARAAGIVLLAALKRTGLSLADMRQRVLQPVQKDRVGVENNRPAKVVVSNSRGTLVFTGKLSMVRREAATMAVAAGWSVADNVNWSTTFVVVGDVDARQLRGADKSNKHQAAEHYIRRGAPVRIITEADFQALVS